MNDYLIAFSLPLHAIESCLQAKNRTSPENYPKIKVAGAVCREIILEIYMLPTTHHCIYNTLYSVCNLTIFICFTWKGVKIQQFCFTKNTGKMIKSSSVIIT